MNRLKFWAYAIVVLAAGAADVVFLSRWLTERSLAQLDRNLHAAVGQVDSRSQLLVTEAAQFAEALGRDPALARALVADGGRDAIDAAQSALQAFQRGPGVDARQTLIAVGTKSGVVARSAGAPVHLDADGASLVAGAATHRAEGYLFVGDGLWYIVALPAAQGASVAIGLPIDGSWLALVRAGTGCGVTLLAEGHRPRTTLSGDDLAVAMPAAGAALGHPVSAGVLPPQRATFATSLPLPALTIPFADAPAFRAQAVAIRGLPGASILLSVPTASLLAPVASYLWLAIAVLALLALVAVALGLTITNEQRAIVPKELVAAADRIARGDFDARAPELAGSLGTVASALNRAAEGAQARAGAAVFETAAATPPAPKAGATEPTAATSKLTPAPMPIPTSAPSTVPAPSEPSQSRDPAPALTPAPIPAPALAAPSVSEAPGLLDMLPPEPAADAAAPEPAPAESPAAPAVAEPPAGAEAPPSAWSWGSIPSEATPAPGPAPFAASASEPSAENGAARADPFADAPPLEPPASSGHPAAESRTEDLFPTPRAAQPVRPADPLAAPPAAEASPAGEVAPTTVPLPPPPAEPPAGASATDEEHWRATYDAFLRVRAECGENASALAFERFRQKLVKNREQLVEKYRCRTVKFQVYVKEGKAALKATPVR